MSTPRSIIPIFFFFSGFCGLLYQLVWVRLAFASFGVNTPILSVVVSVFMAGLGLGSWLGGTLVARSAQGKDPSALRWYAVAEGWIALGALAVPPLFQIGRGWLLSLGEADSGPYLALSALVLFAILLPWCLAMGTTFPLMMEHLRRTDPSPRSFSFLYVANVLGAVTGVVLTAVFLIETLGFRGTLLVGAILNASIALAALALSRGRGDRKTRPKDRALSPRYRLPAGEGREGLIVLFLTGFICMAMEVVWTRGFTLVLRTAVYSYAGLLFAYLLATYLGSHLYRRWGLSRPLGKGPLMGAAFAASLLVLFCNDPAFHYSPTLVLLSIVPFCLVLGYLTPQLVDRYSQGDPSRAARAYAVNVLGCILGPLAASYLLLPWVGVKGSLLLLSFALVPGFLKEGLLLLKTWGPRRSLGVGVPVVLMTAFCLYAAKDYETPTKGRFERHLFYRDYVASVVAGEREGNLSLYVNGVIMTGLHQATKDMAHLPLALLDHSPRSALVICFGMGTTYRSLTSWGIETTCVDLVPSVLKAFPFFHADAARVQAYPKGRMVVDDGRRFLDRTKETYDVITVDPPPPLEAAGSSLLYSTEFYASVKAHLRPGGIFQQWIPVGEKAIWSAAGASLVRAFPHVYVFANPEGIGCHFIASMTPVQVPRTGEPLGRRMPKAAWQDLGEWFRPGRSEAYLRHLLAQERSIEGVLLPPGSPMITDDRPFNEYFILRRLGRLFLTP